ncbi:HNH endonuclease signature motif containing protein [Lentzea sp. NPDC004782]|uniref:HNH endonuclease signature motif containing protein n=1 Tax=Lentzea sp. NPDC004782 TaxID=3154458 RepID=UPI0033B9D434
MCGRPPKQCDAHHVHHWANGGDTSVKNAVLLCRHHHTLIHRSEWEVTMVHGIPTFYAPSWLDPQQNRDVTSSTRSRDRPAFGRGEAKRAGKGLMPTR